MIKLLIKQKNLFININLRKRKGFTLVELLVVLAIIGIFLSVTFSMLFYNQKSYSFIDNRVNAQNEYRFIMNYIEKEIGTATEVKLLNAVDTTLTVDAGYRLIYVGTTSGKGSLFKKEVSTIDQAISLSNIPGLTIEFSRPGTTIIRVKLWSDGDQVLEKDIFTQNAAFADIDALYEPQKYNFIRVKFVN